MAGQSKAIDMTKGPVFGPLIRFILPMIGGSVFQQLYNTVDFIFVGNVMDKTAAAAVGASSTLINITIGLFTGISVGTTVVASRAIGSGRDDLGRKALHTSVAFGLIGGLLLLVLGELFAPNILSILNTPATVLPQAVVYIRLYLISLPMLVFYNMVTGSFRAEGDSSTPFVVLVICGILNVAFDALFILVIPLGVAGVAIATMATQTFSAVLIGLFARRPGRRLRLSAKELHIDGKTLRQVLRIGLPTGIQTIIITFSNIIVQVYINGFGDTAVAAFSTYYKVENLNFLAILAFGQASTAFTGQNMGAVQYKRIRKGSLTLVFTGAVIVLCISGAILGFSGTVFRWFMKDAEVMNLAISLARVTFPLYWIYPFIEVFGGAVRAMGYSLTSMCIIIANLCVVRISLLAVFSKHFGTLQSLAAVYPVTWATAAACFTVAFFLFLRPHLQTNPETGG